jgi:hypothetical protein
VMLATAAMECFHIEEIGWNIGRGGVMPARWCLSSKPRAAAGTVWPRRKGHFAR